MDAGLRDDAAKAKGLLINEIQRGDMARGGQTVSPDLKAKGDERLFKGAKEAIRQGLLTDPSDIEVISDKLSAKQVEELNALMTGSPSTLETMIPIGKTPDLSSAMDGIESLREFQPAATATGPARVWEPPPALGGELADGRLEGPGEGYWPKEWVELFRGDGGPTEYAGSGPTTGGGLDYGPTTGGGLDYGPTTGGSVFPGPGDPRVSSADVLPPDMGLPLPDFGSPSLGGQLADDRLAGSPVAPPAVDPVAEDPIIELAATAGSKGEALAIADEAEASGLFPGARSRMMKAFGWSEEGTQDFGRALMGFGSGLLSGGPDFGAALGNAFSKGADEFAGAKDDRRQAALDDRRIAMEDERLDMAREEMDNRRKQAAIDRLSGEAAATQSGLIYYEDGEGRIRSRKAPLQEGPQDEESRTDLDRLAQWIIMDEGPAKDALGRRWGFLPKEADDPLMLPAA